MNFIIFDINKLFSTMKNLKKISRDELKSVLGGSSTPQCPIGYIYRCEAVGVCDPIFDQYDCVCGCIPRVKRN